MKRYRPYLPVVIFFLGFILALIVTANHQWLYGGYEGLLYHSLEPLLEKDQLSVSGQVSIAPGQVINESDYDSELMNVFAMDFIYRGTYEATAKSGQIDIELRSPAGGEGAAVATIVGEQDRLLMVTEGGGKHILDLKEFLKGEAAQLDLEKLWDECYGHIEVIEIEAMDRRLGGGHLPKEMVAFRLDLMGLLSEEARAELRNALGEASAQPVQLSFLVTHMGELSSIELETGLGDMDLTGFCVIR